MEMFSDKVDEERIRPLKKNKALLPLKKVEEKLIKDIEKYKIELSYDVLAEENPYYKTLAYTEYATNFIIHPLNLDFRTAQIYDAYADNESDIKDWVSYLKDNFKNEKVNKYQNRNQNFEDFREVDNIVVLPGSNKLKDTTNLQKLKDIQKKYGDNIYFKPHPITTYAIIGELMDIFGKEAILPRNIDLYYFLDKAKKVYTTHISESCLYAAVLGKEYEPIDNLKHIERGSFYHINKHLFLHNDNPHDFINKVFSSHKSGIINPLVDDNWKEKLDKYLKYTTDKRKKYKGIFYD